MNATCLLGIQGWDHADWLDDWYPSTLDAAARLGEYSKRFRTVEVDDTFYGIPPEPVISRWRDSVPSDFSFALKAPQQVTHQQRFSGQGELLKRFLSRVSRLDANLGPILLLAPIGFEPSQANKSALRGFVHQLPKDFRWALELRHVGWFSEELHDLLASKNVALVFGENRWIRRSSLPDATKSPTADFAYLRWNNGPNARENVGHSEKREHVSALWSKKLEGLSSLVNTVYGYFNITAYGNGLLSAEELQRTIGQQWREASVSGKAAASPDEDAY